jgi:hypothetical protein
MAPSRNPETDPDRPELMPDDTPTYMAPAWLGCIRWALGKSDILAAFRADTGNTWEPGRTPIDRMIDEATGADREFITAFVKWANPRRTR